VKKIDRLIISSFIPPLIVWFLVAVFIFNMQFLWKYIDDIVGKGLELKIILELLFYQGLAMVPRALVFGVMIASVMTLGNLAEHYELVSMKSAGISLMRILAPLFILVGFLAIASFIFSNNIIPVTALQFKTRLYDIRKQKPALDLEPGQFNNDFKNMVIYIGEKDRDSRKLKNVRIYDHSKPNGNSSQTNAQQGELYFTEDKSQLIIQLNQGQRYENLQLNSKSGPNYLPYMRTSFKEFRTIFDMSEFNFTETDKDLFRKHHSLLTSRQLKNAIDSILIRRDKRIVEMQQSCDNFYHFRKTGLNTQDSTKKENGKQYQPKKAVSPLKIERFSDVFTADERHSMYMRAQGFARNVKTQADNLYRNFPRFEEEVAAHENELHLKIIFSLACILFLFIGAPMGAIIRKGGFGWPIFISFSFFMGFFVLHLTGERLATGLVWPTWMGSWLPIWSLFPIAVLLSVMAMNDSRALPLGFIRRLFRKKKQSLE
jgi:lipopolysaccharide export system permease protein